MNKLKSGSSNLLRQLDPRMIGRSRFMAMLLGNVGIGLGVSIFYVSGLGNDPYSGMNMALSHLLQISYGNFLLLLNSVLFIFQLLSGREYIGSGTLVNWVGVGYAVDLFNRFLDKIHLYPGDFKEAVLIMLAGVLIMSFSVSVYQTANAGISPYDALPFILQKKTKFPYFWCRIFADGICALTCFIAGGIVGLGTFVCAFCLGPFISFFNKNFSEKVIHDKGKKSV